MILNRDNLINQLRQPKRMPQKCRLDAKFVFYQLKNDITSIFHLEVEVVDVLKEWREATAGEGAVPITFGSTEATTHNETSSTKPIQR